MLMQDVAEQLPPRARKDAILAQHVIHLGDVLQGGGLHARDRHEVTRKKDRTRRARPHQWQAQLFQRHELHVFRVRMHVVYVVATGKEAVAAWPFVPQPDADQEDDACPHHFADPLPSA